MQLSRAGQVQARQEQPGQVQARQGRSSQVWSMDTVGECMVWCLAAILVHGSGFYTGERVEGGSRLHS